MVIPEFTGLGVTAPAGENVTDSSEAFETLAARFTCWPVSTASVDAGFGSAAVDAESDTPNAPFSAIVPKTVPCSPAGLIGSTMTVYVPGAVAVREGAVAKVGAPPVALDAPPRQILIPEDGQVLARLRIGCSPGRAAIRIGDNRQANDGERRLAAWPSLELRDEANGPG